VLDLSIPGIHVCVCETCGTKATFVPVLAGVTWVIAVVLMLWGAVWPNTSGLISGVVLALLGAFLTGWGLRNGARFPRVKRMP